MAVTTLAVLLVFFPVATVQGDTFAEARSMTVQARDRLAAGDDTGAKSLLVRALNASPNSVEANLMLGTLLLDERRYPEAMDRFETVLALDQRSSQARKGELAATTGLALQARRAGDQQAALLCLRHAHKSLPDDPTLLYELASQSYDMGFDGAATEALEAALKLVPHDPQDIYLLARIETDEELLPAAEQHFLGYLRLRPQDASAYFGLGRVLQRQLRADEAVAAFRRSIALQPVQTESYFELGQMALNAGRNDEARELFRKTLGRAATHGGALTGLGILDFRERRYEEAVASLRLATESSPEYQPAHYFLGLSLGRLGLKEESDRELKRAVDMAAAQQGKSAPVPVEPPLE